MVNDTAPYEVDGRQIPWVQPDEATRYLGKMFGPWGGMTVLNFKRQIDEWARSDAAAPLKPFQALEIWRDTILPRVKARILRSRPSLSMLKGSDTQIRGHVKSLLHLPMQTTNALLYARTRNDGLGTTCLEDAVPDRTIRGLRKLCRKNKSETIRRLARRLGVRDTLEDLCVRFPRFRPVPPGRKKRSDEKLQERGNSSIPKEKWCEYLASQATHDMGSETWMKYKECNQKIFLDQWLQFLTGCRTSYYMKITKQLLPACAKISGFYVISTINTCRD